MGKTLKHKNWDKNSDKGPMEQSELSYYLNQMKKYPPLSYDETLDLFKKIEQGDAKARDKLIYSNQGLVITIAKEYKVKTIPLSDLISEGNIGLIKSIEKFDYEQYKTSFSTYAAYWIKAFILKYITDNSEIVNLPMHMYNKKRRLTSIKDYVSVNSDGSLKNNKDLEQKLLEIGWSSSEIKHIENIHTDKSIFIDFSDESNDVIYRFSNDKSADPTFEEVLNSLTKENMLNLIEKTLSEKEKQVISLRFGIFSGQAHTLQEVGDRFGITRERIRQIEKRAIKKMNNFLKSNSYSLK